MGAFKLSDWNDLIQQVNTLAIDPDTGCDPLDPLDEVTAPHRWSKSDIQSIQDKLIEICEDNTFDTIPDKWMQSTVDEINEAIAAGWCGCDDCVPPCSDAGYEAEYFASHVGYGCIANPPPDPYPYSNIIHYRQQVIATSEAAVTASGAYDDYFALYCGAQEQVDTLQDMVDAQQTVVDELCGQIPPDPGCPAAQVLLEAYQDSLDEWTAIRDNYQEQMESYKAQADEAALAQMAWFAGFSGSGYTNIISQLAAVTKEWADQTCDKLPPGWYGGGPQRCRCQWAWHYGPPWTSMLRGVFTPNGLPYATEAINAAPLWSNYCCMCFGGECEGCSCPGDDPCTTEFRIVVSSPASTEPECPSE